MSTDANVDISGRREARYVIRAHPSIDSDQWPGTHRVSAVNVIPLDIIETFTLDAVDRSVFTACQAWLERNGHAYHFNGGLKR